MPNKGKKISTNANSLKQESNSSSSHIPYILNGELYKIQTRNGENVTVKCCNCPPDRVYRGSVRSTGNFHMHIKRRHSALLGKLHEMKVAALLERRDRLRNMRRIGGLQCGSGSTKNVANEERELKIKTVFKRHKQEQQEQGEQQAKQKIKKPETDAAIAAANDTIATKVADETQDNQLESVDIDMENTQVASNTPHVFDDPVPAPYDTSQEEMMPPPLHSLDTQQYSVSPGLVNSIASQLYNYNAPVGGTTYLANPTSFFNQFGQIMNAANINNTMMASNAINPIFNQFYPLIGNSNIGGGAMQQSNFLSSYGLPFGLIKPELLPAAAAPTPTPPQQQLLQPIDLTMHTINSNFNHASSPDVDCQITPTVTITEPSELLNANARSIFKDLCMRIEGTLRDIHVQLNIRNQIESKRMVLDMAKFKFQHPEFGFQF